MQKLKQKGMGILEVLLVIVVISVIGLVSLLVYKRNHITKSQIPTGSLSYPNSASTPSPTPTPTVADPYAGWKSYTSKQEPGLSFKYPNDWKAENTGSADPEGEGMQVTSASGTNVRWDSNVSGIGGGCGTDHTIVTAIEALPSASGLYLIVTATGNQPPHYGVIDGPPPSVGHDFGTCAFYTSFKSNKYSSRDLWLNTNGPTHASDEATIKLILKSLNY